VTRAGASLEALPPGARIGTGSARRAVQLRALQPDIETADIRGNVDTRLRKVDEGQYDGVVLALAALERLGVRERATQVFGLDVMVPAVGQGALVVEARGYDGELLELLRSIEDAASRLAVEAERAFLGRLGSGCTLPVGALAAIEGDAVRIRGMLADEAGDRIVRDELSGPASEAVALGARLAEQLLESIDG
jgi:hydroxymethylbilane synthase